MNRSSRSASIGFRTAPFVAMAAMTILLAACGNKGPLFMPQKPVPIDPPVVTPADETPTADELRDEQDATSDPTDEPDDEND